jgi:hypothetical protein
MIPTGKIDMRRLWTGLGHAEPSLRIREGASVIGAGLCLVLLFVSHALRPAFAAADNTQLPSLFRVIEVPSTREIVAIPPPVKSRTEALPVVPVVQVVHRTKRANFGGEHASADARHVADWVVDSRDNGRRPFVIVDKVKAKVFVFDPEGNLSGAAPALLGLAPGDDTVPGIGKRKLATIRPEERTTPAGRFVSSMDRDVHGQEVLWVDYDAAISMHRVVTSNPKERRLQRLGSLTAREHRISYGCINIPAKFYDKVLSPAFKGTDGIVYVLPETRSAREVFASYDVGEPIAPEVAGQARPLATAMNAQPVK